YKAILSKNIFSNSFIWYMSFTTLSLYMVRITFLNWFPYYLIEACNYSPKSAALEFTGFEVFGILGGFCTGYIADKFRGEKKIGVGLIISFLLCVSICASIVLLNHTFLFSFTVFLIGFFVYAIQVISGLIANDSVDIESTSVATGLLGAFAYIGASLSGILVGYLVDHYGWDSMFMFIFIGSVLCCIFFFMAQMQTNKQYTNNMIYNK
ncbi:MAG: MFS transporter, partial [Alphaproteobacteria bacterium]|nr:MFS transporter [Alphaproteobacteria bacterium]